MSSNNKLVFSRPACVKLLFINTNGLDNRPLTSTSGDIIGIKNKCAAIRELVREHDIRAVGIAETHGSPVKDRFFGLPISHSTNAGRKGGTAIVSFDKKEISTKGESGKDWCSMHLNVADTSVVFVTTYFPPDAKRTKEVAASLRSWLEVNRDRNIILSADFNVTDTESSADVAGLGAKSNPTRKAEISALLEEFDFKDQ